MCDFRAMQVWLQLNQKLKRLQSHSLRKGNVLKRTRRTLGASTRASPASVTSMRKIEAAASVWPVYKNGP